MSFAFGLAVFGTALAVALRAYLIASATEQREILDRITLDSTANDMLGRLAAGEVHSIKPVQLASIALNQRRVAVELSLPEGKRDLQGDPDRVLLDALDGYGREVAGKVSAAPSGFKSLEGLSRAWRLSAGEEDCLRRVATAGRAPEVYRPEAAPGSGEGLTRTITAGDQVDIRVALVTSAGSRALWVRARFTGTVDRPWRVHDYRRLTLGSSPATCRAAD